jgi:hypothetical protein
VTEGLALAPLVWRDVLTAVRTPAVWAVMAVQVTLMALYLLVWGDGVPLVGARPVLAQFATTQWVFLSLALPWAAARCGTARRRDDVAQLAALGAVRPSAVVGASLLAASGILLAIAAAGLPFSILAQQISAAPAAEWWRTEGPLFALSLCVAPITTACMLVLANRLFAWTVATALTLGTLALTPAGEAGGLVLLAVGAIVGGLLVSRADSHFLYLSEPS